MNERYKKAESSKEIHFPKVMEYRRSWKYSSNNNRNLAFQTGRNSTECFLSTLLTQNLATDPHLPYLND